MKSLDGERLRLAQHDLIAEMQRVHDPMDLICVHSFEQVAHHHFRIQRCILVPNDGVDEFLKTTSWSLSPSWDMPGTRFRNWRCEDETLEHVRWDNDGGFEPLVISRDFGEIKPWCFELREDFRLFHRLWHDVSKNRLYKINATGSLDLVAAIAADKVSVRLQEIREFISAYNMNLVLWYEHHEHTPCTLEELGIAEGQLEEYRNEIACWDNRYADFGGGGSRGVSVLRGKRWIAPLPNARGRLGRISEEIPQEYEAFIVGTNEDGTVRKLSAGEAKREASTFLTRLKFRKGVLDKYYHEPAKYEVLDRLIRCGSLWDLPVDNLHDDFVWAFLGDLGRLPHEEQVYWRSYNIAPSEGMSAAFLAGQFNCEFVSSDRPEHEFKVRYDELASACNELLDWQVLEPLSKGDEHHLATLREPSTEEQSEFDALVLSLTKIIIDYLNEDKLAALLLSSVIGKNMKGIDKLEAVFAAANPEGASPHVQFLRKLQALRSAGAAHRKGKKFKKASAAVDLGKESPRTVFKALLAEANAFLAFLADMVRSGAFDEASNALGKQS